MRLIIMAAMMLVVTELQMQLINLLTLITPV